MLVSNYGAIEKGKKGKKSKTEEGGIIFYKRNHFVIGYQIQLSVLAFSINFFLCFSTSKSVTWTVQ